VLGLAKGWDNPAWIDNQHTLAFNPGADAFPDGVNVAYHELVVGILLRVWLLRAWSPWPCPEPRVTRHLSVEPSWL
jgi:hypothetical protein